MPEPTSVRLQAINRHVRWLLDFRQLDDDTRRAACDEHVSNFQIPQATRSDRSDLHAQVSMAAALVEAVATKVEVQAASRGRVQVARIHDDGWETLYWVTAEERPPYRLVTLGVEQLPREFIHSTEPSVIGSHRVLLVGNSYTFHNEMPAMLVGLASAADEQLEAVTIAAGGATLEQLWDDGTAAARLDDSGPWAAVILQDQSHRPILEPVLTVEYGSRFAALARAHGARPMIFGTWARQDKPEEQDQLDRTYGELAHACGGSLVPVGAAFASVRTTRPDLNLYERDNLHPSLAGSYLAACTLYASLFDQSPVGLPSGPALVAKADVELLQRSAWLAYEGQQPVSPGP